MMEKVRLLQNVSRTERIRETKVKLIDKVETAMQLQTDRLTIRRVTEEDWKGLQCIWKDFSASEYAQYDMPHVTADDDVRVRVCKWAKYSDSLEHMFFAICIGDTIIGYIAFNIRRDSYEIGYCFLSDYHGMGYAKESHRALFDYLRTLGITKFTAGTGMGNTPSVSLLKSLGFELVGTESVSFYKDAQGNDIVFDGGIFELSTVQ